MLKSALFSASVIWKKSYYTIKYFFIHVIHANFTIMPDKITLHPTLQHRHFAEIDSTNAYLLQAEQPYNQLISADTQTAGRGRRQQTWVDEKQSLLFSLSFEFDPTLNMSAWAVQVAMTLAKTLNRCSLQRIKIKWSNDLYCQNAGATWGKCAGILIESNVGQQGKMVTGIGINLSPLATDIQADYPVAYLETTWEKNDLLYLLANALLSAWQGFTATQRIDCHAYQAHDMLLGKTIAVSDFAHQQTHVGQACGVNEAGQLLLLQHGKITPITSQQRIRLI